MDPEIFIFNQGRDAFLNGKSADANPYSENMNRFAFMIWNDGWDCERLKKKKKRPKV